MPQANETNRFCPRPEITAYLDGDLSPREEFDLDLHFAGCAACTDELNQQKKLLCALDFALEEQYGISRTDDSLISAWQPFETRAYRVPDTAPAPGMNP